MKKLLRFSSAIALAVWGVAATGASAASAPVMGSADAAATGAAAEGDGDEIVVTAQKREQRLIEISSSIAVVDPRLMQEAGVKDLIDVSRLTPGVLVKPQAAGGRTMQSFTVRGIGFDDFRPNGAPSAAVHIDGVYQGSTAFVGGQMFDVERIEILRGPQGTLYGQNTTAGVVNIISKGPSDTLKGEARVEYGRFNSFRAEAAVGGPLADGIGLRIAGVFDQTDGYLTNLGTGSFAGTTPNPAIPGLPNPKIDTKAGRDRFYSGRAILTVERDGTSLRFNAHGFKENGATAQLERQQAAGKYPANDPFTFDVAAFPFLNKYSWGTSISLDQDVSSHISLAAIVGYDELNQKFFASTDAVPTRTADGTFDDSLNQQYVEVRIQNKLPAEFEWVFGGTYFENYNHSLTGYDLSDNARTKVFTDYTQKSRSFALFGDGTYHFNSKLKLGAGLRYTGSVTTFSGSTIDQNPYGISTGFAAMPVYFDRRLHDTAPSGRVVLTYDANRHTSVYASINRGFKAGGFDGSTISSYSESDPFRSEKVWTYEVGAKFLPRSGPIQLQISAFYNDFSDMQASAVRLVYGVATSVRTNVGKAETYGLEFEGTVKPLDGLNMQFGIALLNSKVLDIVSDNEAQRLRRLGNQLPQAPRVTLTGAIRYEIPVNDDLSVTSSVNGRFVSGYYTELDNYEEIPGYFLGNTQIELSSRSHGFSVAGWVRNFTNARYATALYIAPPAYAQLRGAPRTYGVSLGYKF